MSLTAGVGDIGCTVDGAAAMDFVVDAAATVGAADESCAAVAGGEAATAAPAAGLLAMPAFSPSDPGADSLEKAEVRSAVIRWYIRLGLVVAGSEDVLATDRADETGDSTIVALVELCGRIVAAGGLMDTLEVEFWTRTAVCPLPDNPSRPP